MESSQNESALNPWPSAPKTINHPRSSPPNLRPSVARSGRRGGRRAGAGAPKGNLNGLKHGLYSKQLARLGLAFASSPKLQEALLTLAKRQQSKQQKAELVAAQIFTTILKRGFDIKTEQQSLVIQDFHDSIDRI